MEDELARKAGEEAVKEACTGLEKYRARLKERLKRCLLRRRAKRIDRLAYLTRLGREKGTFSPGEMARDTGIDYRIVHADLRLLLRLGVVRRLKWGRYRIEDNLKRLEEEIAGRLAALELRRMEG
jgi:DNA-binding transcriptional ArsR family regulator